MEKPAKKNTQPATTGLWKKINAIQTESAKVFKDTDAVFGKSSKRVASIESVLDTYLPLCAKHGVSIVPVRVEPTKLEFKPDQYGKDFLHIIAFCHYKAVDVDSGDCHEFAVISHGADNQDKAPGKLMSYALKYAYYQLFSARRGDDDPDVAGDVHKDEDGKKPKKTAPTEDANPEPKDNKDDADLAAKRKAMYDEAVAEIKGKYSANEAAEKKVVPGGKEYNAHVAGIVKHIEDSEVRKHVGDFALYWWQCLDVAGNKDLEAVKKHFAKGKARMSKSNVEYLEKQIKRREDAAKE